MTARSKTQRPANRKHIGDRMKLHLRKISLRGEEFRVVTLRPQTRVSFSTNFFHQTWHILGDQHGAQLLARLMWGLSFQRHTKTAVLIHGEHIQPTPFGAEPSDSILVKLSNTAMSKAQFKALRSKLNRLGPSQQTVRWHTFGLDRFLEEERLSRKTDRTQETHKYDWVWYKSNKHLWQRETMSRLSGFVCYSSPSVVMRHQASIIAGMDPSHHGMDYHYIADRNDHFYFPDGEVQIFSDYRERCSAAAEARQSVEPNEIVGADPETRYQAIATKRDAILRNRRREKQRRAKSKKLRSETAS